MTSAYDTLVLGRSPTAYYPSSQADTSGNGLSGTVHGGVTTGQASLAAGLSTSMLFDGNVGTNISLPNGARQQNPCTFEMWILDNSIASNGLWMSASASAVEFGWNVGASGVYIAGNGGNFTSGTLISGTVYYIAITIDASLNFSGYYAKVTDTNVTALGSGRPSGSSINYGANALFIGSRNDGSLAWKGYMSNVAIYAMVLSQTQANASLVAGQTAPVAPTGASAVPRQRHHSFGRIG